MIAQTANRLAGRTKALIVAFVLGLVLAVGLYASAGAQPADAYSGGRVCTHESYGHYGPSGRLHGMIFKDHWWFEGSHWHRWSHYTKVNGNWQWNYTRTFNCGVPA